MTFPLVCFCIAVPWPVVTLVKTLARIRSFIFAALVYLGLLSRPTDPWSSSAEAVPPPRPSPSSIKAQLPVVEFAAVARVSRRCCCTDATDDAGAVCAFCLERLELRDQVRELGNCRHAFHKGCIDEWLDKGQVSCPMCRSDVLPSRWRRWNKGPVFECVVGMLKRHGLDRDN